MTRITVHFLAKTPKAARTIPHIAADGKFAAAGPILSAVGDTVSLMKRRDFIKDSGLAVATMALAGRTAFSGTSEFESRRPPVAKRKFVSRAVETKIAEVKAAIKDNEMAWMFENCYPNTLDTTVEIGTRDRKPDSFVITGDIHAMWLRDSTAQVTPYLSLAKNDPDLQMLIKGLIHRQAFCVLLEPYANAFLKDPSEKGWDDLPPSKPGVHERKWEVDSLCYVIRLAYQYWKVTGDVSRLITNGRLQCG